MEPSSITLDDSSDSDDDGDDKPRSRASNAPARRCTSDHARFRTACSNSSIRRAEHTRKVSSVLELKAEQGAMARSLWDI